jgi:nucleotide-binding universal stress UspA family protein
MRPGTIVCVLESFSADDVVLTKALSLADWYGSDLHVVHVGPSSEATESGEGDLVERIAAGAGSLPAPDVHIRSAVLSGGGVGAIAGYANRVGAGLIVLGKTAPRGQGYRSAGSFVAALGKRVTAPTIVIPGGPVSPALAAPVFRNVLCAIDFSEVSLRALTAALRLAQESGGRLTLLHVLDGFPYETVYSGSRAFRLLQKWRTHVEEVNRELIALIPPDASNWTEIDVASVPGEVDEAIVTAAAERRSDLIVLGLPRRPRWEDLVSGSTVHRVLRRTTPPVLLVPGRSTASLFRPTHQRDVPFVWGRSPSAARGRAAT